MIAFSVGAGITLGVINVFIRDLAHVVPILLQLVFWATPIVYPITIIPERLKYLLVFNPLITLVNAYQQLLLNGTAPDLQQLATLILLSASLLGLGYVVFRRASPEMVDVLFEGFIYAVS
jgi:lipopolysaccharide transport system permease protein